MPIRSFLRPAPTWTAEQVREFLRQHHPEDYQLIDVSQAKEYAEGHLPGAHLIPLEELEERLGEFDPEKTAIVYGGSGLRSRAAANVLINAGFREVATMEGGIQAWEGKKAEGLPQEDFSYFAAARFA